MVEQNNFEVMKDLSGYFKEGERKAIYNSAESFRDKVLIRLLWITGRRINEILNIKVYDINFEDKQIIIHVEKKTKKIGEDENGKSIRSKLDKLSLSYIDKFTTELITSYIKSYELLKTDYLFKSDFKNNSPITRQRAFQIIRKSCNNAGINRVGNSEPHPHHFRHSFAVDMARKLKSPADIRKLQLMLDHSSLSVTEKYLKFADEEVRGLIDHIGE